MNTQQAYNSWSSSYDSMLNKTRDLEAQAIRAIVPERKFTEALELGCGTGKNTGWLAGKAAQLTAADFSVEMMQMAKGKTGAGNVEFQQLDITRSWPFEAGTFDLITCSLILEHIKDLDHVFAQAGRVLKAGGLFYAGELHPFKQYQGSKARFETGSGTFELECFVHHISDFTGAATKNGLSCIKLDEWFEDNDRTTVPRVVTFLFRKD